MHPIRGTETDSEVLQCLGAGLARRRLARNQSQAELAEEAGVSRATVQRLEAGHSTQLGNLVRVLRALGLPGLDTLVAEPEIRPLDVFEQGRRQRRRASPRRDEAGADADEPWTWGDEA